MLDHSKYNNRVSLEPPQDPESDKKLKACADEMERIKQARRDARAKSHEAYRAEEARLEKQFKADLEKEYRTANNPKRDLLYRLAYEMGHSSGYSEIEIYYEQLVPLVQEVKP